MSEKKCHNLVEWLDGVILLCEKGDGFYVPKLSDLKQYCKSKDHNNCPFYMKFSEFRPEIHAAYMDRKGGGNEIFCK